MISASPAPDMHGAADKPFDNLRAELALRGYCLVRIADGSLLITRSDSVHPMPDLRAATNFFRQIGGVA